MVSVLLALGILIVALLIFLSGSDDDSNNGGGGGGRRELVPVRVRVSASRPAFDRRRLR